jgi:malonyl-CoA O-methyltransferase
MFDKKLVSSDFSNAAHDYDNHTNLQQKVLKNLLSKLDHISQSALILDAGCGTGQLAQILADTPIIQYDIAYGMCNKARRAYAPAINGDIAALPFADNCFDIVFSSLALQWLPNYPQATRELERVVKPGGMLAISTFGSNTLKELKESFVQIDAYSHISSFISGSEFTEHETIVEFFPDLYSIMQQLKAIGARNKMMGRRKSLMTRRQMLEMEIYYKKRFGSPQGLPVTWETLYLVRQKT